MKFAIGHYQFEEIHPFLDGNGRIGRLLVPLFLYEKNITAHPNIYISEFLEKHRDIYYDLLNAVSRKNEWIPWIRFFLEAIQKQTEIFLERVIKIEKLYKDLKEKMPELNSIYANSFLDALFIKPRFTAKSTRELTGETNTQTLYNLIDKFIEFDIISDIIPQKERNKIYAFSDLIKIVS